MKYGVWFVRFLFAAWMIPAGLNHFVPLFPQPLGSQPLSQELIHALIDSQLFDLVKAVELIAGVLVLFGAWTPLALVICLPVSFGVFYWDAPLEGWGSRAALFGYATLLCNSLLCLAFIKYYRSMFTFRASPAQQQQLVLAGRVIFGAWMLLNGLNHWFLSLWSVPSSADPLAMQLMTALVNSRLLDVVMAMQLVGGALILANVIVPFALCAMMPLSSCALFWVLVLDQQPLNMLLGVVAFALNGLLMLAYLPYYKDTLTRHAQAIGEAAGENQNYDNLFANPNGRTPQNVFIPALITLLLAIGFFAYYVTGRTAEFCMLMLLYPLFVLLARRLQDMGRSALLLGVPVALMLVYFATLLGYLGSGEGVSTTLTWVALAVTAAFALWGGVGHGRGKHG